MDTFIEQIVPMRKTTGQMFLQMFYWFAAVIISVVIFFVMGIIPSIGIFGFVAMGGAFYLAFRLSSNLNIEYEYSVTNEFFDLDKITARRKRKRILSIKIKDFESFGIFDAARQEHRNYDKRIIAGNVGGEGVYYGSLRVKDMGHVLLVMEPEERVLNALKKYLPSQVARDAFRGN